MKVTSSVGCGSPNGPVVHSGSVSVPVCSGGVNLETIVTFTYFPITGMFMSTEQTSGANLDKGQPFVFDYSYQVEGVTKTGSVTLTNPASGWNYYVLKGPIAVIDADGSTVYISISEEEPSTASVELEAPVPGRRDRHQQPILADDDLPNDRNVQPWLWKERGDLHARHGGLTPSWRCSQLGGALGALLPVATQGSRLFPEANRCRPKVEELVRGRTRKCRGDLGYRGIASGVQGSGRADLSGRQGWRTTAHSATGTGSAKTSFVRSTISDLLNGQDISQDNQAISSDVLTSRVHQLGYGAWPAAPIRLVGHELAMTRGELEA